VIGSSWRCCHGQAPDWSVSGAAAPPPKMVDWQFEWNVVGRISWPSLRRPSVTFPPPLQPPRV
jgi:hypothetical protein